jgi:hypothetical protein
MGEFKCVTFKLICFEKLNFGQRGLYFESKDMELNWIVMKNELSMR